MFTGSRALRTSRAKHVCMHSIGPGWPLGHGGDVAGPAIAGALGCRGPCSHNSGSLNNWLCLVPGSRAGYKSTYSVLLRAGRLGTPHTGTGGSNKHWGLGAPGAISLSRLCWGNTGSAGLGTTG